jgi:hypothetical protein
MGFPIIVDFFAAQEGGAHAAFEFAAGVGRDLVALV